MKKTNFVLRFDKEGNSTRLYSNGIIAVKVKTEPNFSYKIIDIKNGVTIINKACMSHRNMLVCIRRDINQLFEIYSSSDKYNVVFSKPLSLKQRRI